MFFVIAGDFDIIDEALMYFKANIFFRNFEIKVSNVFYLCVKVYNICFSVLSLDTTC